MPVRPDPGSGAAGTTAPRRSRLPVDLVALAVFGLVVALAAGLGSLGMSGERREYTSLVQPDWAPPGWVFGPVWTVLYVTIAVSGWLMWRRTGFGWPMLPYAVQLVLNAVWTPIFFGAGAYGLAVVDIVALWLAIGATVVAFLRVHRGAALLLLPYWGWVTFATALNVAIWQANP